MHTGEMAGAAAARRMNHKLGGVTRDSDEAGSTVRVVVVFFFLLCGAGLLAWPFLLHPQPHITRRRVSSAPPSHVVPQAPTHPRRRWSRFWTTRRHMACRFLTEHLDER
jgi:hypothetical protein